MNKQVRLNVKCLTLLAGVNIINGTLYTLARISIGNHAMASPIRD
jgi:hypothetical protein